MVKKELKKNWPVMQLPHPRYLRTEGSKLLFTVTVVVPSTFWV